MHYVRLVNGAAWNDLIAPRASKKWAGLVVLALVIAVGLAVAFAAAKVHTRNPRREFGWLASEHGPADLAGCGKARQRNGARRRTEKLLGIRRGGKEQIALASSADSHSPLVMPGSTALDPAGLVRVRVRFAPAEVVEIGKTVDSHVSPGKYRPRAASCSRAIMFVKATFWRCSTASIWATRKTTSSMPSRSCGWTPKCSTRPSPSRRPCRRFTCSTPSTTFKPI